MPSIAVDVSGDHEKVGREMGSDVLPIIHTTSDWLIDALEHGMQSGATSLMVFIPVKVEGIDALVMAETSLQCWMMAATILAAKFDAEVNKPGWAILSPQARAIFGPRFAEALHRAIPGAAPQEIADAVEMILDGYAADAPPEMWDPNAGT